MTEGKSLARLVLKPYAISGNSLLLLVLRNHEKRRSPLSLVAPPLRGVVRGSGELANHSVLPSITRQLLPYAGVVSHGRRPQ